MSVLMWKLTDQKGLGMQVLYFFWKLKYSDSGSTRCLQTCLKYREPNFSFLWHSGNSKFDRNGDYLIYILVHICQLHTFHRLCHGSPHYTDILHYQQYHPGTPHSPNTNFPAFLGTSHTCVHSNLDSRQTSVGMDNNRLE